MALPVIALAATIGSTALGVVGSIQQGKAANAAAKYNAQVARNNAQVQEWQAKDAEARGRTKELQHRQQVSQLIGRQRAVMAGNGVDVNLGSAVDLQADTASQGEFDALTIRSNAEREAYAARVGASNYTAEAGLQIGQGKAAKQAGFMGAGTTLLSGAGSVADKWLTYRKAA